MKKLSFVILVLLFTIGLTSCTVPVKGKVNVVFDTQGGTRVESIEVDFGTSISEPTKPTKEGYGFSGWYLDENDDVAYRFSTELSEDITLFAQWEINTYTLSVFDHAGNLFDEHEITYNQTLTTIDYPNNEIPVGYRMVCSPQLPEKMPSQDLDINCEYVYFESTINFITNNGMELDPVTQGENTLLEIPVDLVKENAIFDGWYTDENLENEFLNNLMPRDDITLHAKWGNIGDTYNIFFVPSRPADEILTMTEPLAGLLEAELAQLGFDNISFNISVATSYEAAGEALHAGTADIAFLPGSTYVSYKDVEGSPIDVILAATREGLSKDSSNAADWNDGLETIRDTTKQVPYYRGLIISGPSAAGQAVAAIVNAGNDLTWDDVKDLNWCVRSTTSSSGYVYPDLWLKDMFGKTFFDVTGLITQTSGYGDTISMLSNGTCDVGTIYADARMNYADDWTESYGRTASIWDETNVVGVTGNIMNDTISVSRINLDQGIIDAIQQAFINIAKTDAGLAVMEVYSHTNYVVALDSDYDSARALREFMGE